MVTLWPLWWRRSNGSRRMRTRVLRRLVSRSWVRPLMPSAPPLFRRPFSTPSPAVKLTDSCVQRLRALAEKHGNSTRLRLEVNAGGCSGFQYSFRLDSSPLGPDDILVERDGVGLVVDAISLPYVEGATVNFESEIAKSAFVVEENPNAQQKCGCGSSFVAKE